VEAARVLLDAGADPNARARIYDAYCFTALTGAMGEGEGGLENQPPHPRARALAELLLERGADANDSQGLYNTHFTPGNEWIELLLSHGLTSQDKANWLEGDDAIGTLDYLLGVSVTWGFAERVELLLRHGANPDGRDVYDDRCHYENALLYGRPEIAEILLAHGAERIALTPASEFRARCMAGDARAARALLERDPSLIDDDRLIHDAIRHASDEAVRLLFELGGSLEAEGQHYRETPLHQAAIQGRDAPVDQLLALGARLDLRDASFDGTAVSWASQGGHDSLRDRLLDRSEDVFDLARFGRVDQLRALLAADPAQARRTRARGVTALHLLECPADRAAAVIDLLLANGAAIDAATEDGVTPLAAAFERDDEEVADLLRERGARAPLSPTVP
jgi:ankyrin repeat protein